VGTYRLWRDLGYAAGALLSGVVADLFGLGWAIGVVGLLTAASGFVVLNWMRETAPALRTREPGPALEDAGVTWPG
jgi:predicted MFS family arabinose efflux permease